MVEKPGTMSEDNERQRGKGCAVMLPILYVLSFGPIAVYVYDDAPPTTKRTIEALYTPLGFVLELPALGDPLGDLLNGYIDWCESWMP